MVAPRRRADNPRLRRTDQATSPRGHLDLYVFNPEERAAR